MTDIRLGTQGWSYADWVGVFYPPQTKPSDYLRFYSQVFDTVELDTTFYSTPRPALVRSWAETTPDGFLFTAKLPQAITHEKHLKDCERELDAFVSAMRLLGPKLGALHIQLPPDFRDFLRLLNSHGVEYLLIGGYAVAYHGYPRATAGRRAGFAVDARSTSSARRHR